MFDELTKLGAAPQTRAEKDLELWNTWKQNGEQPEDLKPLLGNFRGMLRSRANRYIRGSELDLPSSTIHAEFNKQFLRAVETYDPSRSALGTWVEHNLKKAPRWVATYRNPARIGSKRFDKVGQFDSAKAILDDQLGREPSTEELADYLGWAPAEVGRMESEKRRVLMTSGWESDPTTMAPSIEAEALNLVRYDLTDKEKEVYDHLVGYGGKTALKPKQVAQVVGVSPSTITRVKDSIEDKLRKYLKPY